MDSKTAYPHGSAVRHPFFLVSYNFSHALLFFHSHHLATLYDDLLDLVPFLFKFNILTTNYMVLFS